jgi:hypothetical protein
MSGMLEMNQKAPDSNTVNTPGTNAIQGDDAKQTIEKIKSLYNEFKAGREAISRDWVSYFDFYKGKQWPQRGLAAQPPVINWIRPVIQTIVPILTDTFPGYNISPQEPQDYDFSKTLDKVNEKWWDDNSMDLTVVEWVTDSQIYGVGIFKVIWNADALSGIGDIEVKLCDPDNIFVPKKARDFDKDCHCVIERDWKSIGYLKRKFPDFADEIKVDSAQPDKTYTGEKAATFQVISPVDVHIPMKTDSIFTGVEEELCEVWECWMDSPELEDYEEEDDDGNIENKQKLKYPNGKLCTLLPNQDLLLVEAENPFKDGQKPYVRLVDVQLPRKFYGEGEVEPLMELNKTFNTLYASLIKQFNMMSNPVWILDTNCGITPDQVSNQISLVLVKNAGTTAERLQGVSPPPALLEMMSIVPKLMDTVSGVHDITQGRKPPGITSGVALDTMQEAAQTRIRLKERNLQVALKQLGKLVVSRILQFVREPRIVKITTPNEPWPQFFEFHIEEVPDEVVGDTKYKLVKKEYNVNEGKYLPGNITETPPSKGIFDIDVVAGSNQPYNKDRKTVTAFRLFEMGIIDAKEVLDQIEWPNAPEVLARMEQMRQQAAQAQAQAIAMQQKNQQPQGIKPPKMQPV